MGKVVYDFMPIRCAERYVELRMTKGVDYAKKWWASFPWNPTDLEGRRLIYYVNKFLRPDSSPPFPTE